MALLVASASGFCALAYELLWSRSLLAAVTDDTTYAFTLMLTAYLAGSAAGVEDAAGHSGGDQSPGGDWRRLGTAQMMAAACALVSVPLLVVIRDPISRESFTEGMTFWGSSGPVPPDDQPGGVSSRPLRTFWAAASSSPPDCMSARAIRWARKSAGSMD